MWLALFKLSLGYEVRCPWLDVATVALLLPFLPAAHLAGKGLTVLYHSSGTSLPMDRSLQQAKAANTVYVGSLLLASALTLQCAALSTSGVPEHVWQQVLDIEPNRHLQQLGQISEEGGVLTRTYLSGAHKQAAKQIKQWMQQAGMSADIDAIGNVHGVVEGSQPELGELIVGSHYDTVVDGGKYDGALGIILGISAVKAVLLEALYRAGKLQQQLQHWKLPNDGAAAADIVLSIEMVKGLLPGAVRVVAFCDEEGMRFKSTFWGSRALAGTFAQHNQLTASDANGTVFEDVLKESSGVQDPAAAVQALALDPKTVRGYVEFHLEQGPQLEAAGLPLAVVSAIAGQTWLTVSMEGEQGHAGTVPMLLRKDPMSGAAEGISVIEALCLGAQAVTGGRNLDDEGSEDDGEGLVCTVGRIQVHPNQVNIIPKWVNFTVDVRCKSQELREQIVGLIEEHLQPVCSKRRLSCTMSRLHDAKPVRSDGQLLGQLKSAVLKAQPIIQQLVPEEQQSQAQGNAMNQQAHGICDSRTSTDAEDDSSHPGSCSSAGHTQASASTFSVRQSSIPILVSGAGHDAMAMADLTKIAMVFVRCAGGISHNPAEHVDARDVTAAAAAFATFMEMDLLDVAAIKDEWHADSPATCGTVQVVNV